MSNSDRRPYQSATILDQQFLNDSVDNLTNKLEMVADIVTPNRTLRLSDRAKFLDGTYYDPRINFPQTIRPIGDWLAGILEFADTEIPINNADGEFDNIMPGGADYAGFIGSEITIRVGIGEIGSTYIQLFKGKVTDIGGFNRDRTAFTLIARPDEEKVNVTIPNQALIEDDFPNLEDEFIGLLVPVIYGDWTTNLRPEGSAVPAFPVNGADIAVNDALGDPSAGDTELRLVISSTPLDTLDDTTITLQRGNAFFIFDSSDITIVPSTNNTVFDITQKNLLIDGSPWIYTTGDTFFVQCTGPDLGAFNDNIIEQGRNLLIRFGGLFAGDFDSSWDTVRDKDTPSTPENSVSLIKSRIWLQKGTPAFEFVLSLFEQVRVEAFVDRNNKFKLSTLHFDDFGTKAALSTNLTIRNWDLVDNSLNPKIDDRNNFNTAKADFDFDPSKQQARKSTPIFKNTAAVAQAGRGISKLISFPQLYISTDVISQLKEILKLAGGTTELVDVGLTTRFFLPDLGDFVSLNSQIGSVNYNEEPAMIRTVGYNPAGPSIPMLLWSYQLINFPGHVGPAGTVGGDDAVIEQET